MANLLTVGIRASTGPLATGLRRARGMVNNFATGVAGQIAGAFAIGAVIGSVKSTLQKAEDLDDIAKRFGMSAKEFQAAANVADKNGSSFNALEKALRSITIRSQEALRGNDRYLESFNKLGLSMDDLRSKSPLDLFFKMSDALQGASGDTKTLAAVSETLGARQIELFTTMKMGSKAILEQGKAMGTWEDQTTEALANANVEIRKVKDQLSVSLGNALGFVMDSFNTAVTAIFLFSKSLTGVFENTLTMIKRVIGATFEMVRAFGNIGEMVAAFLTGDFSGAAEAASQFKEKFSTAFTDIGVASRNMIMNSFRDLQNNAQAFKEIYSDIWKAPAASGEGGSPISDPEGDIEALRRIEDLKTEIAEMEEQRRIEGLSNAERILELEERRTDLAKEANLDTIKGLEAKRELLQIEKELLDLKEQEKEAEDAIRKEAEAREEEIAATAQRQKERERSEAESLLGDLTNRISTLLSSPTDSITRIGGGRIGTASFQSNTLRSLLTEQQRAVKHLKNLDDKVTGQNNAMNMLP